MTSAWLLVFAAVLTGSPRADAAPSAISAPEEIATPARLREFASAIGAMAPVLVGTPGRYAFRSTAEFDPRILLGFFSRDGISFVRETGRSIGHVSASRLSKELAAKKGETYKVLLAVSFSLRSSYEGGFPTAVLRDGQTLKMAVGEQFVVTFVW